MLLQIPIEHIVFMGLVMHDENNALFSGEVEHRLQCIFELDVLSQTLSFRSVSCFRCQPKSGQVNSSPASNCIVTVFGIHRKTTYIHPVMAANWLSVT